MIFENILRSLLLDFIVLILFITDNLTQPFPRFFILSTFIISVFNENYSNTHKFFFCVSFPYKNKPILICAGNKKIPERK